MDEARVGPHRRIGDHGIIGDMETAALVAADGRWRVEPGAFDVRVSAGQDADAVATGTFTVAAAMG